MPAIRYEVLGIGNAIVDVIARTEEDFLLKQGMNKGGMALIDEPRAEAIYKAMGPAVETSGGSAANTIVGVASLGVRSAFIGKVKDDLLGRAFSHDIRAAGVAFTTTPAARGPSTARCYVLVTPDGERTMNTYLGAAQNLHPSDIDADLVAGSAILYLEGYLWDPKDAKDAFLKAAKIAHQAERTVALSLSDAFCVDRWRDEFLHLMRSRTVDLIFANEAELSSLYQTADFDTAVAVLRKDIGTAVITRSEKGCIVIGPDGTEAVSAFPVERVVDTTGAGDLFAAGFLCGLARGADDRTCGRLGALAAGEIIQHLGARPETSLQDLARQNGLLD
ncbi:MAG: adenosine kinase [Hyphomicrobiales bacterium]|nr:adenosine kinase [Hyphomicrobiales bacterium]